MEVDNHVHITENGKWFNTGLDASLTALLKEMDKAGVEKSVILPIAGVVRNSFVAKTVRDFKDRLIGFGCVSMKSWKQDLSEIGQMELRGVKFHPRIQNESIIDWDEMGILAELECKSLPLLVCGWQQTSALNADMLKIQPLVIDRIAKKYPNLKIIIAHMGGHKFYDAYFCSRGNRNVFLDCSYFFDFFQGTSLVTDALTLFKKLDKKIIFGSDFPETSISKSKAFLLENADRYEIDTNKLFRENIFKVIGHE